MARTVPPPVRDPVTRARPERAQQRARRRLPPEVIMLAVLALVTRLAWITSPRDIVFDEVYFRDFALRYADGSYYFDVHPPLGKLLLGAWAWLLGVDATAAAPDGIPATPASMDPTVELRLLPALAGVALIVVFYYFLRELRAGRKVATLGAGLLLLDNALLVQSRLILIDSLLLLFGFAAITLFLAARRRTGRAYWLMLTAAGLLAGASAATKVTGLTALGLIALVWGFGVLRGRVPWREFAPQAAVLALAPAAIYVGAFALHVALLPNSGPGDNFMSAQYRSTLIGNPGYDPDASMSLPARLIELNQKIQHYQESVASKTHPYSSEWTSWPLQQRPVYYWTDGVRDSAGQQRYIYLLGNPVVWWGVLLALAVIVVGWVRRPERFAPYHRVFALLGLAWAASYLPFALIERPMFLYHYFFPLLISLAAAVIGLGVLAGWTPRSGPGGWLFASVRSAWLYWGIVAAAAVAFVWFSPLSYGLPLTEDALGQRMWLNSWR